MMKIERRITFIIGREGFATWKLNRLKTLTGFFHSVIILQNITTREAANTAHTLKVMSLGCKRNDLCQLWIAGADAELACMVLTDFIHDQFDIVNTFRRRKISRNKSIIENHPAFHIPFSIDYYFEAIVVNNQTEKNALISRLSKTLSSTKHQAVLTALLAREEISSTGIGNQIAIPHIMINDIKKPSMAVFRLDKPINWHSNLGEVTLIIALLIPAPPTREVVKAFTQITRSLLNPINCNLLTSTTEPEAIKAILFHIMAKVEIESQN